MDTITYSKEFLQLLPRGNIAKNFKSSVNFNPECSSNTQDNVLRQNDIWDLGRRPGAYISRSILRCIWIDKLLKKINSILTC